MKKLLPVLLFVLPVLLAFTGDLETQKSRPAGCFVTESSPGKGIKKSQTKLLMTFKTIDDSIITDSILMSYNGTSTVAHPDKNGQAWLTIPAKKTRFQFYCNQNYFEIYSDSIALTGGHLTKMSVVFYSAADLQIEVDKPVIYVYPDSTRVVNIRLDVKGQLGFTYPEYNTSCMNRVARGWEFTADPNGTIHMNGKEYDYLFWEGRVPFTAAITDHKKGFIVQRDSLVPFFEKNLTAMGLNAREQQDFITYWCPVMNKYQRSFVQFRFNDECNSIAGMNITPKPDHLFRVYMLFEDASEMEWNTEPGQIIPHFSREGFTVVEWGGADVSRQLVSEQ